MTTRPAFGDFATAAASQLAYAAGPPGPGGTPARTAGNVPEFACSLRRLLAVMTRYSADIESAIARLPPDARGQMGPWLRASSRTSESLRNAAAFLGPGPPDTTQASRDGATAPAARAVDAATTALTAGRDLLHTHLATRPGGELLARSEWAPVLTSPAITRALLHELGSWAGQVAPCGGQLAIARAPVRGTPDERRRLNAACQWLWVLDWAIQAADEHQPVTVADLALLHAIPAGAVEPRHLPDGTEPVTALCQAITATAERVRHHARTAVPRAAWSPALTTESLCETAAYATVIAHNCHLVLRTLTTRHPGLTVQLTQAARAAGDARQAWLHARRAWGPLITDTRGIISHAAAETADLALWTGRLAYASPEWTPGLGPGWPLRAPEQLAPQPADLAAVITAVHHTCHTLTQLAGADHAQITAASLTRRLLLPTRQLPEEFDIPYPYGPAHGAATEPLLTAYHHARTASASATTRTAAIASAIQAASQILTTAHAVTTGSSAAAGGRNAPQQAPAPRRTGTELPGPVERILHDLGVTSPGTLQQATAIDRAAEQLILQTLHQPDPRRPHPALRDPSRSASTAEIINHLLASRDPRAAALLHPPEPAPAPQPEIEP